MGRCCMYHQSPRSQRRINGLQLPLHYQQIIGWFVFVVTALLNFIVLIQIQFDELKIISLIIYVVLYASHIVSHVTALLMDPSERELRKLKVNNVPEFDRNVHAHVIENGRCHLCNIHTSSKNTKHCSICNKCVDHFDHHCKWLNNCIGQRNYAAFIACVTTALLISIFTTFLCLTDIVLFLVHPQKLSPVAQNFINCSSIVDMPYNNYCKNSISFLTFLIILCVSALGVACALFHLCCFHVYISILGVSTYEYIVKGSSTQNSQSVCTTKEKCRINISTTLCIISRYNKKKTSYQTSAEGSIDSIPKEKPDKTMKLDMNEPNVADVIGILINTELDRTKKIFQYDNNKIYPQNETINGN